MSPPYFFSWIDEPLLAACAEPAGPEQLAWLRDHGVDILITLTEEQLPRSWVDAAGLMSVHVPIPDMDVPTADQLEQVLAVIDKAQASGMGAAIHCLAGRGRTGTVLAAYFVHRGLSAREAIQKVRDLRPGSIEVPEQEDAIRAFERSRRTA
jgi:atypical dual specificity phosphatase